MTNVYCTRADIKSALHDVAWTDDYDALLDMIIERSSRLIDQYTNREPGSYWSDTDTVRYFDGSGNHQLWIDELAAVPTAVAMSESGIVDQPGGTGGEYTVLSASDYLPWPYNASLLRLPYIRLDLNLMGGTYGSWYAFRKGVKITGKWGYSLTPPEEIITATVVQSIRLFKDGQAGFLDVGAIPELGQLRYSRSLHPIAEDMVLHLRRLTI